MAKRKTTVNEQGFRLAPACASRREPEGGGTALQNIVAHRALAHLRMAAAHIDEAASLLKKAETQPPPRHSELDHVADVTTLGEPEDA